MPEETVTVTRDDANDRYDLMVGGEAAGFAAFHRDAEGRLVFDHTVVDDAFGGRGLGKQLAAAALADVAERGEVVVPECLFIAKYLGKNEVPGLQVEWPDDADAASPADPSE